MSIRSILLTITITNFIIAQPFERNIGGIKIFSSGKEYKNVFSGGLNNPEFQFVDIDADTDPDLFVLNSDGSFLFFKNIGSPQNAEFLLELNSPQGFHPINWFCFTDIDNDSDFDYFTGTENSLIRLYRNTGTIQTPFFTLETDSLKDTLGNLIFSESASNPAFCDVDNDGDKDFISGNSAGTLYFYENVGSPTYPVYKFITDYWQNILIISGGKKYRHGASSIEFGDLDNDGDFDLLWGDFFSRSLYLIKNNGTASVPFFEVTSSVFPVNDDSLITSGFNMPRLSDIDNDGDPDLFVSVLYDPTVPQSLIHFKNFGNSTSYDFRKITDDFLFTFDVSTQSVPVSADLDNDGDMDLIVGYSTNPQGGLRYFRNIGTQQNPVFEFSASMFSDIKSELSNAPAFADFDNDSDLDLLLGRFDGTIVYYRNSGSANNPQFDSVSLLSDAANQVIDAGLLARLALKDLDNDGWVDLILGGFNGKLAFYKNTGLLNTLPVFEKYPQYFSGIDVGDNSSAQIADFNNDTKFDLIVGNRVGQLFYYENSGAPLNPVWNLITTEFTQFFGGEATPYFLDLDSDTDLDILLGTVKGGLVFFKNQRVVTDIRHETEEKTVQNNLLVDVFPNPFNSYISIRFSLLYNSHLSIRIFNILGELVFTLPNTYYTAGEHIVGVPFHSISNVSAASVIFFVEIKSYSSMRIVKIIYSK